MQITLTTAGLAAANNAAQAGLQLAISEIAVGTAYYSPSAAAAALQAEVARFPVAGGTDSGNVIRLTALVDGNGAFPIGEIGFFTAEGLLFALYSNPAAPFAHKSAAGSVALEFDLVLSAVPAGSVTLTPSGSLNLDLSEELAGLALAHIDGMSRDLRNRLERPGGIIEATITAHEAAPDPHPQYLTQAEGDVRYLLSNEEQQDLLTAHVNDSNPHPVYLTAAEGDAAYAAAGHTHSYDAAGTAAALIAAHEGTADPHPQYLTLTEGNAAYDATGTAAALVSAHAGTADPHPQYLTLTDGNAAYDAAGTAAALIAAHEGTADPHPGYLTLSDGNSAYAPLSHASATNNPHSVTADQVLPSQTSQSGKYLTTNGTTASWGSVSAGGLTYFTEARGTSAPNATVPAHSVTATGAEANIDAVVKPKGSGALIAAIPDNTATGGNKRGTYAFDGQTARTANTHVASGNYSAILGGDSNTASANYAASLAGYGNSVSAQYAANVCGNSNIVNAIYGFNGGGISNTVSGQYAVNGGGSTNTASGDYSCIPGGYLATTRGLLGRMSFASGQFAATGDAQIGTMVLRRQTTNGSTTNLTTNGAAISATNIAVLPNNSAYAVRATLVAREPTTGDAKMFTFDALVKRGANAAATAIVGSQTSVVVAADTNASAWTAALAVDTTNGGVLMNVIGEAAKTIRWVCLLETTEVA